MEGSPPAGARPRRTWSASHGSGARPPFSVIDGALSRLLSCRAPQCVRPRVRVRTVHRRALPLAPPWCFLHCVVPERCDGASSSLGGGLGHPRSRARRSSAASSRCPRCGNAHWSGSLCYLASGALRRAEKKSTGPGLEPTTPGSSTQLLNHSDTEARCFGCLHFHSLECAWRFLQPGAGGTRRFSAAPRATSDSPKSNWGIAGLDGVALERTPRRVLASPPGARGTVRRSTRGYLQCRFLLGCGGLHALGWRGLHDAGFPTVVVASPPAGLGVPTPLGCRMELHARPGALSSSRGPSPRNGPT